MIKIDIKKRLFGANGDMELDINLNIKEGEFIAIAGDSGSGKSTLLRILAGLEEATGEIKINDRVWLNRQTFLPPQKREIGFVFQDYALFTNMTIEQNLLFVNRDREFANYLLEITELTNLKNRVPNSLSGGQKQRVSLCRALMNRPKLLLMDEPLSALDPLMRKKLQNKILTLHNQLKITTIMVTHDPSEIYHLADRVIILKLGKIINMGEPKEVLLRTKGSQKFSFEGEILDIIRVDVIYIAIISIGQQLVEVVISSSEAKDLKIGEKIQVSTKAFSPNISKELQVNN
jgi:molybdate transport system ATP-binding protein